MDKEPLDSTCYDGNVIKKRKKKKTHDPERGGNTLKRTNVSVDNELQFGDVGNPNEELVWDPDEAMPKDKKKKKKKKLNETLGGEEDKPVQIGEDAKVQEDPVDDTVSQKKKKKRLSATHHSVGEALVDLSIGNDESVDDKSVRKKKKKKSAKHCIVEETQADLGKVNEKQFDGELFEKKKKKKSAKHCVVEETLADLVKVRQEQFDDELSQIMKERKSAMHCFGKETVADLDKGEEKQIDNVLTKKKKKKMSAAHCSDEETSVDDTLSWKKRKIKKSVNDCLTEESVGHMVEVQEKSADDTVLKKKKTIVNDSFGDVSVKEKEGPSEESLFRKKKKRKLVNDVCIGEIIDGSEMIQEDPVEDIGKDRRKQDTREADDLLGGTSFNQENTSTKAKNDRENIINIQRNMGNGHHNTKPAWMANKKFQPRYMSIPPQNVDNWLPLNFKFDNHPNVRHYIPKKLMAMNGIRQQLDLMDEIDLKVPPILFRGSSVNDIPGYGYGLEI